MATDESSIWHIINVNKGPDLNTIHFSVGNSLRVAPIQTTHASNTC